MKRSPSRAPEPSWRRGEARLGWALALPALATIALVALFPIVWTFWESLHLHDLRMPWLGRPFVGSANYTEVADRSPVLERARRTRRSSRRPRSRSSSRSAWCWRWRWTASFAARARSHGRAAAVGDSDGGRGAGLALHVREPGRPRISGCSRAWDWQPPTWFADAVAAWVPLILADVWKTTPFVALLLLAGLQNIDRSLYEAADVDGAGAWRQFVDITLPLLRPAMLVAFLFRTLDAFRVFDLVYVMTGGGPGTATEPIALYTFSTLLQNLRFGYGSALSVMIFAVTFAAARSSASASSAAMRLRGCERR